MAAERPEQLKKFTGGARAVRQTRENIGLVQTSQADERLGGGKTITRIARDT